MRYFFIGLAVITLAACSSAVRIDKYYTKELKIMGDKYGRMVVAPFAQTAPFTNKYFAKKTLTGVEYFIATTPDSTGLADSIALAEFSRTHMQPRVDSFYFNKSKIDFLIKNNLVTSNIKFPRQ